MKTGWAMAPAAALMPSAVRHVRIHAGREPCAEWFAFFMKLDLPIGRSRRCQVATKLASVISKAKAKAERLIG